MTNLPQPFQDEREILYVHNSCSHSPHPSISLDIQVIELEKMSRELNYHSERLTLEEKYLSMANIQHLKLTSPSCMGFLWILNTGTQLAIGHLKHYPTTIMKTHRASLTSIASSWERYRWNPSMGRTAATSGGLTWVSNEGPFWGHNSFTRCTTSEAKVLFPAPGGPANPTMCLQAY